MQKVLLCRSSTAILWPTWCTISRSADYPSLRLRTCAHGFSKAMTSKSKDIVFLLGAGASVEAEIPSSGKMINQIEYLLSKASEASSAPCTAMAISKRRLPAVTIS